MRLQILSLALFICEINAICFVPNRVCNTMTAVFKADCGIKCKSKEEKKCSSFSVFHPKKDHDSVILSATALQAGPLKTIEFNATLLNTAWQTFRLKIFRADSPKLGICRTYESPGTLPSPTNFQIRIKGIQDYPELENKEVTFQYDIKTANRSTYGKFTFIFPNFERFAKIGQIDDLELFNYIDQSDEEILKLKVQVPPKQLYYVPNINVQVFKDKDEVAKAVLPAFGEQVHYTYNATGQKGSYYFAISPNSTACNPAGCYKTLSPVIDFSPGNMILIISIIAVVAILFIVIGICCCCRKGCSCGSCSCNF